MSISLMNLLVGGSNTNLGALLTGAETGSAGLTAQQGNAFASIMAAAGEQGITAEQLQQYFLGQNIFMGASPSDGQGKAATFLSQLLQGGGQQNLPAELQLLLQDVATGEVTPELAALMQEAQTVTQGSETGITLEAFLEKVLSGEGEGDLFAQLPNRELTPEELSDIVQKTGFPPAVIFAVLQDTPAASPNLAAAMVENMGEAEKGAGLLPAHMAAARQNAFAAASASDDVPQTVSPENASIKPAQTATPQQVSVQQNAAMLNQVQQATALVDETQQAAAQQTGKQENIPLTSEQRQILQQIIRALKGEKVADTTGQATAATAQGGTKPSADATAEVQDKAASAKVVAFPQVGEGKPANNQMQVQINTENASLEGKAVQAASQNMGASQTVDGAEVAQLSQTAPATETPAVRSAQAASAPETPFRAHVVNTVFEPTVDQVAVRLRQAVQDGSSRMEIRLQPAELGRVDVRIDTGSDGQSHVTITADRKDTLDLLQRDARVLERALQDAGVKTDSNSLSFQHREGQQQHAKDGQADRQDGGKVFDPDNPDAMEMEDKRNTSETALTYSLGKSYRLTLDGGVDIRA